MSLAPMRPATIPRLNLMLAVFVGCTARQGPSNGPGDRRLEAHLGGLLDSARVAAEAPGAILGILESGKPAIVVARGSLDLAGATPIQPNQAFFLGSVSKTYTAAVVLRLAELGRLSLDDPIARFLPDFPRGTEITVRHLLSHTSGLKDFYSYLYYRPDRQEMIDFVTRSWTQPELLELAGRFGHWFAPGADWSYSNTGYYLLGVIAERASGLSLPEAYRRYLYQPLGLDDTWLAFHEPDKGGLGVGHLGPVEGWKHSEMFGAIGPTAALDRSPVEWGAGGLAAPATDGLSFLQGLMTGRLLADSTLDAMISFRSTPPLGVPARTDSAAPVDGYGLGLVRMSRAGFTLVGHGGLFTGHTAGLWHVPECGFSVALYFNRGFVGQREVLDRLMTAVGDGSLGIGRCGTGGADLVGVIGRWTATDDGGAGLTVDGSQWSGQTSAAELARSSERWFGGANESFAANGSAPTAFPLAIAAGVPRFTGGTLRVQFKLIGGAGDHTAGLVFNLTPLGEYRFVRYNTKDGNLAIWEFANGQRRVLAHGTGHGQLALGVWHQLEVTVRGSELTAQIAGRPEINLTHRLEAAPSGRVGLWTKREAVTAFRNFQVSHSP
ncbi:MAG: serine hydrolase domain-containing protein [Gemmatimonadales bacterium]